MRRLARIGSLVVPPEPSQDDNVLLTRWRAAQGRAAQEEAFRRIFERFYRPVAGFFHKRGFPSQDCEDLAQETFLRVYRSLAEFRGEARLDTWIFKVAANLYCNTLRSRGTQKREGKELSLDAPATLAALEDALPAEGGSPLEESLEHEREAMLERAIQSLPPQTRRCLELRIACGLKYLEIAEVLRISGDTVKTHLLQARRRLRSALGEHYGNLDIR